MDTLQKILQAKPYLAWYVANKNKLSEESALEHILNYGSWNDFKEAEKGLGLKRIKFLFDKITNKRRVNLRPQTINYFTNYLEKYA